MMDVLLAWQVINVLPFVLIGIGVDDMFVLLNALADVPVDLPVPERIARTMASAGVSITITSLTDVAAFALGTTSRIPAISAFCTFAAVGIVAEYRAPRSCPRATCFRWSSEASADRDR